VSVETSPRSIGRDALVRRATVLNRLTIGWNAIEGIVAIAAGVAASSVSLVAFGLDSGIEVSAALVLAWRLHQERRDGCQLPADDRARRLVAWSFVALASYVSVMATIDLIGRHEPEASTLGIAIAALSLIVMAAVAEAAQTNVCTMLSAALLVGLSANAVLGWWWADPVAGLIIAGVSAWMAVRTFRAESLEHTCCG
jgi:divalent metal cation (Fe/Co/Zn/Cd) transporter